MTEEEIAVAINAALTNGQAVIAQDPFDERVFRMVKRISKRRCHLPEEHPDWEPGWCVDFASGEYATLEVFEPYHFFRINPAIVPVEGAQV
jgi:hypothetical protein